MAEPASAAPRDSVIRIDADLHLLQSHRLVQACMETRHTVSVPADQRRNVEYLMRFFDGLNVTVAAPGARRVAAVTIDHVAPRVALGPLSRPLLFPHALVRASRGLWDERSLQYTFVGLVTPQRRRFLDRFAQSLGDRLPTVNPLRAGLALRRGRAVMARSPSGQITAWASQRGRQFPVKLWDPQYFQTLARSRYVLCPKGDYNWSYRFFEACLCGAMPVVEQPDLSYAGFHYVDLSDDGRSPPSPSADVTQENFERARELLTAPVDELEDVLSRLAADRPDRPDRAATVT